MFVSKKKQEQLEREQFQKCKEDYKAIMNNTEMSDDKRAYELYKLAFNRNHYDSLLQFIKLLRYSQELKAKYESFKGLKVYDPNTGTHYSYSSSFEDYTLLMLAYYREGFWEDFHI